MGFANAIRASAVVTYAVARLVATLWLLFSYSNSAEETHGSWPTAGLAATTVGAILSLGLVLMSVRAIARTRQADDDRRDPISRLERKQTQHPNHNGTTGDGIADAEGIARFKMPLAALAIFDQLFFTTTVCAFGTLHTVAAIEAAVAPPVLVATLLSLSLGLCLATGNAIGIAIATGKLGGSLWHPLSPIVADWYLFVLFPFFVIVPAWMFSMLLERIERLQRTLERLAVARGLLVRSALRDKTEANRIHHGLHVAENGLFALDLLLSGGGSRREMPEESNSDDAALLSLAARRLANHMRAELARLGSDERMR